MKEYILSHPATYLMLLCATLGVMLVMFSLGEMCYKIYRIYKQN